METWLFWIYLLNAVIIINHEIDSAYWKEWELFHLPGGLSGFLLIHFLLLFLILFGLVQVFQHTLSGLWLSLLLSAGGLAAFGVHMYFLTHGREEFKNPVSQSILWATWGLSVVQMSMTLVLMVKH